MLKPALGRHDDDVRRQPRDVLAQLAEDRLTRRREAADLGGVHADQQLQIRPRREVPARLHQPVEHVRERVGRIVQLRVPRHVGQQADHRSRAIEADRRGDVLGVLRGRPMEHDPVEHALAAARQVLHQLAFLRGRELAGSPSATRGSFISVW